MLSPQQDRTLPFAVRGPLAWLPGDLEMLPIIPVAPGAPPVNLPGSPSSGSAATPTNTSGGTPAFALFMASLAVLTIGVVVVEKQNMKAAWAIVGLLMLGMLLSWPGAKQNFDSLRQAVLGADSTQRVGGFHEG